MPEIALFLVGLFYSALAFAPVWTVAKGVKDPTTVYEQAMTRKDEKLRPGAQP